MDRPSVSARQTEYRLWKTGAHLSVLNDRQRARASKDRFRERYQFDRGVQPFISENFAFPEAQISCMLRPSCSARGAFRPIATDVGAGSDGRFDVARRATSEADGKIAWS